MLRFSSLSARKILFLLFATAAPALASHAAVAGAAPASGLALPPPPDQSLAPEAFKRWNKFVGVPLANGWIKPGHLITAAPAATTTLREPARLIAPTPAPVPGAVRRTSSANWSGSVFSDETQPFKVEAIIGEFVVPNARQPLGVCDRRDSSFWVGIDGWDEKGTPASLLQAGFGAVSDCLNGVQTAKYHAWIEWLPIDSQPVDRPRVRPGDLMFVEVWSVSPQKGFAYLYNHSLREGAIYVLTAPAPANALTGKSVEWIVERPAHDHIFSNLTNYSAASAPFGVAWNYRSTDQRYFYPGKAPTPSGATPSTTTLNLVTMTDQKKPISTPLIVNNYFLFFENSGSSASAGE